MSIHMAVYYLRGLQWSATTVYPQNIAVQASLRVVHQQSSQQCYNDLRSEFPNYVCWLVNPSTKLLCGISIWRFPKLGVPPKSFILKGFSNINQQFLGTPVYGNLHMLIIRMCWIRFLWCAAEHSACFTKKHSSQFRSYEKSCFRFAKNHKSSRFI